MGSADCSKQLWRLLSKVFPELRTLKWFKRTRADAMAAWPWEVVLRLKDLTFGDLTFANGDEDDPKGPDSCGGIPHLARDDELDETRSSDPREQKTWVFGDIHRPFGVLESTWPFGHLIMQPRRHRGLRGARARPMIGCKPQRHRDLREEQ